MLRMCEGLDRFSDLRSEISNLIGMAVNISKQLHDALAHRTSISGNTRYRELQAAWDDAFREFESATDEFSAIVKRMHEEAEARRIEESETE